MKIVYLRFTGILLWESKGDRWIPIAKGQERGNNFHVNMKMSSNGNSFRVTGHLCGEFTGPGDFPTQRLVTQSLDVFFDPSLNNRLS